MIKYKSFVILLFVTSFIYGQGFTPSYQSNPSLDFDNFLTGVKYAYIKLDNYDVQHITQVPNSSKAYAVKGLVSYLEAIGFKNVNWGNTENTPQNLASLCDLVLVSPSWDFEKNAYKNISLHFASCRGDIFSFQSSETISNRNTRSISNNFYNAFIKMYQRKSSYSQHHRLSLQSEITSWTEEKLKNYLIEKKTDLPEGIYEKLVSSPSDIKYKLGIIKDEDGYKLIYLSGAINYSDWIEGEIKANLETTATAGFFKAQWKMFDKTINPNAYVSFETGIMNLLMPSSEKSTYLKLFPTTNSLSAPISKSGSGTGFAVSADGLIVTNQHVVNEVNEINIKGINGDFKKTYTARVILEDKNNDLAIIKIEDKNFTTLGDIPFVISKKNIDVGSSIFVMGYPLRATMGDEIKLTNGIISSKSGFQGDVTSYQISAPIQPGNSGGPLFDNDGNIVGIINARHARAENAAYAVKASYLLNLLDLINPALKLQNISSVSGLSLIEQVKLLKKFTYIVEVN